MRKLLIAAALALPGLIAAPVAAGEVSGVVELFTSQGCNSCPPADRTLATLVEEGQVLALSYHVDYWDFYGWKDTLSDAAHTERQRGYARSLGERSIYTPQAVVNGRDHLNGADGRGIRRLVDSMTSSGKGLAVSVGLRMDGDGIEVDIGTGNGRADIVAIYFDEANTVAIERGENTGKTITYHHSVRDMETIGMWKGEAMTLTLPRSVLKAHPGRGCAILVQSVSEDGSPSAILGAAVMEPRPTG